ncbi:hypothetical protein GEMRC1_001687 [Eukaryota sp. GEM-RC1]
MAISSDLNFIENSWKFLHALFQAIPHFEKLEHNIEISVLFLNLSGQCFRSRCSLVLAHDLAYSYQTNFLKLLNLDRPGYVPPELISSVVSLLQVAIDNDYFEFFGTFCRCLSNISIIHPQFYLQASNFDDFVLFLLSLVFSSAIVKNDILLPVLSILKPLSLTSGFQISKYVEQFSDFSVFKTKDCESVSGFLSILATSCAISTTQIALRDIIIKFFKFLDPSHLLSCYSVLMESLLSNISDFSQHSFQLVLVLLVKPLISNGCHGKAEPLLSAFSESGIRNKSLGGSIGSWRNSQEIVLDFTTVDSCNSTVLLPKKYLMMNFRPLTMLKTRKFFDTLIVLKN